MMSSRTQRGICSLLLLTGCERIVSVNVDEGPKRLVVEGRILRIQGSNSANQTIRLSLTNAYFNASAPPPATGATVQVNDGTSTVTFTESSPGVYTTASLTGVVGRVYTLSIQYAGESYGSVDTLRAVAPIDTLYFIPPTANFGDDDEGDGLAATIDFTETAGERNWYLWEQIENGQRPFVEEVFLRFPVAANDFGIDGRELLEFQPFSSEAVFPRDTVVIRQFGISRGMFNYYSAMAEQTANDGSPFSVPPSNVRGNVRNLTNPSRPALGYFFAAEVSEARAVVP